MNKPDFPFAPGSIAVLPADEPGTYWQLATQVCTPKQLRVLELREKHHFGWERIADTIGITSTTVRGHYKAATKNIHDARLAATKLQDEAA